jgi:hypothetical protein
VILFFCLIVNRLSETVTEPSVPNRPPVINQHEMEDIAGRDNQGQEIIKLFAARVI